MLQLAIIAAAAAVSPAPAAAGEIFGGLLVHDVDTPITKSGLEGGVDVQLGWRGDRLRALKAIGSPSPHAFVSLSSGSDSHFAAAGISWKLGKRLYARPGIGIAVHTGSDGDFQRTDRIAFGSRVLFAPEFGLGYQLNDRASIEASWVHLSHATLLSRQNPGMDSIGLRFSYRLR